VSGQGPQRSCGMDICAGANLCDVLADDPADRPLRRSAGRRIERHPGKMSPCRAPLYRRSRVTRRMDSNCGLGMNRQSCVEALAKRGRRCVARISVKKFARSSLRILARSFG
jgi:hypothetical protein